MSGINRRPISWYESWMVEDENAESGRGGRKQAADQLLRDIESGHYDSKTLQEFIQILDHECLCYESTQIEDVAIPQISLIRAFTSHWTDAALEKLSGPIIRPINSASHFERELQARGLLSALALLRAQGVGSFRPSDYDRLRNQFKDRFRDFQLQRTQAEQFSKEKFRQLQCLYLISSAAEYANHFERAEPPLITLLSRLTNLMFAAASVGAVGATGYMAGPMRATLRDLDQALRPLWSSPSERYQALFVLQRLTSASVAFNLISNVRNSAGSLNEEQQANVSAVYECSLNLAGVALHKILLELDKHGDYEYNVRPRSTSWDYFLAIIERGPPSMDLFLYIYGLMDCAAKLCSILPYAMLRREFRTRMTKIICRNGEERYRWKAIEILLSDSQTRAILSRRILGLVKQANPSLENTVKNAIEVLCDCFGEEESFQLPRRPSQASSFISNSSLDRDIRLRLLPDHWKEDNFRRFSTSADCQIFRVRPLQPKILSVGLSPTCNFVYFLSKNSVAVCTLPPPDRIADESTIRQVLFEERDRRIGRNSEYQIAAISERLLCIITEITLVVLGFGLSTGERQNVGEEMFPADSPGCRWAPDCLAICETVDRCFIAVGGSETHTRDGVICGSITIYQVDTTETGEMKLVSDCERFGLRTLHGDFLKTMSFSSNGLKLACVTNNNRVLVWTLSNKARPEYAPFVISKKYRTETRAEGITSVTIFNSPSARPYMLCTNSPSRERISFEGGEWSFISPVADLPAEVPKELDQSLWEERPNEAILAGAASPSGDVVAIIEKTGLIRLFPLEPNKEGGLSRAHEPINLNKTLCKQEKASCTSIRFRLRELGARFYLYLYAMDTKGTVLVKRIDAGPPLLPAVTLNGVVNGDDIAIQQPLTQPGIVDELMEAPMRIDPLT